MLLSCLNHPSMEPVVQSACPILFLTAIPHCTCWSFLAETPLAFALSASENQGTAMKVSGVKPACRSRTVMPETNGNLQQALDGDGPIWKERGTQQDSALLLSYFGCIKAGGTCSSVTYLETMSTWWWWKTVVSYIFLVHFQKLLEICPV